MEHSSTYRTTTCDGCKRRAFVRRVVDGSKLCDDCAEKSAQNDRGFYGAKAPPTIVGQQRTAQPGEDNYGFVDRYTAGHAAFGVLAGLGRLPWWATLASGLFFDLVVERQFKDKWPELWPNPTQDTWQNITGDTIAMMLGWEVAMLLPSGKRPLHTTIRKELP